MVISFMDSPQLFFFCFKALLLAAIYLHSELYIFCEFSFLKLQSIFFLTFLSSGLIHNIVWIVHNSKAICLNSEQVFMVNLMWSSINAMKSKLWFFLATKYFTKYSGYFIRFWMLHFFHFYIANRLHSLHVHSLSSLFFEKWIFQ